MKKIILGLCLIISSISMFSQTGLQDIVVEKVNAAPTVAGATTYRVFADMATDWQLQAVFALSTHEMFFQTSTSFYNTPSFGVSLGQNINEAVFSLAPGLAYDSYITIGAASTTSLGVLRSVSPWTYCRNRFTYPDCWSRFQCTLWCSSIQWQVFHIPGNL
jgi:hypothetical protein